MRIARRSIKSFDPSGSDHLTVNTFMSDTVNALQSIQFGSGAPSGAENIECDFATVTFAGVGTELTAAHGLRRAPIGMWLIKADRAGNIYNSASADSASAYLKSDTASLSGIIIFI